MPSVWSSLVVNARDPGSLARFWAAVLGYDVVDEEDGVVTIAPPSRTGPLVDFAPVPEEKAGRNRLHVDLTPTDQAAEVERILGLGARYADVGQGEQSWVVLADPEGNEFCVLAARP